MHPLLAPGPLETSSDDLSQTQTKTRALPAEKHSPFIIDGGWSHTVRESNGALKYLARYEVWREMPSPGGLRCIDRGDDLAALQAQYAVADEDVLYWPIGAAPVPTRAHALDHAT